MFSRGHFKGNAISRYYMTTSAPYNASTSRRRAVGISGCMCVDYADDGLEGAALGTAIGVKACEA